MNTKQEKRIIPADPEESLQKYIKDNYRIVEVTDKNIKRIYDEKGNIIKLKIYWFLGAEKHHASVLAGRELFDIYNEAENGEYVILERYLSLAAFAHYKTKEEAQIAVEKDARESNHAWFLPAMKRNEETIRHYDELLHSPYDFRRGKDASQEDIIRTFGLHDLSFNKHISLYIRPLLLNRTYDSLMDLALAAGLAPECIGLNHRITIHFGAVPGKRIVHTANAEYFPTINTIEIPINKLEGSLAHEWIHALDYNFPNLIADSLRKTGMDIPEPDNSDWKGNISTASEYILDGRIEVPKEFRDFVWNLAYTSANSNDINAFWKIQRNQPNYSYLTRPHELMARTGEVAIMQKLKELNIEDHFLTGSELQYYKPIYPQREERKKLAENFFNMIQALVRHHILPEMDQKTAEDLLTSKKEA